MLARICLLAALLAIPAAAQASSRIKDITTLRGVRTNQLVGYGLVIGLNGTGDGMRNSPFTEQSIQSMLDRLGINVRNANPRTRNVAAVIATAELPPFAGNGSRIDVSIASLGDATSLTGGTLVLTPLNGADGEVYAVAQGAVMVAGLSASGKAETVTQGVPTSARIPGGAIVEREVPNAMEREATLVLELRNPDFGTAVRIADVINDYATTNFQMSVARASDLRTVTLRRPRNVPAARFIGELGELTVEPDTAARVVVDERTGTVVMGRDVRISKVAVAQGNITVRITEDEAVSQPAPLSRGRTVVTPLTNVEVTKEKGRFEFVGGNSLESLVRGLNAMGIKPADVVAILQAIKAAGALQADLVVQ